MCECGGNHETSVRVTCRACRVLHDYAPQEITVVCWSHGYYSYRFQCANCGASDERPTPANYAEAMIDVGSPTLHEKVAGEFLSPDVRHDHRVPPITEQSVERFVEQVGSASLVETELMGLVTYFAENDRSQQ